MSTIAISNGTANTVTITPDTTGNVVFTTTGGIINSASLTGAVLLPSGTTGERTTAGNGSIRYNTSNASLEVYVAGAWATFP